MRRNAVRSIGVEACLFQQKELEQLYAVFKVINSPHCCHSGELLKLKKLCRSGHLGIMHGY